MTKTIALDRGREVAFGFLYWLTFLTALEPGNLLSAGDKLVLGEEAVRIGGAALLGALSAPFALALLRHFPIERGPHLARHLTIDVGGAIAVAFVLIVASCVLAPLFAVGDTRPFLTALPSQLQANWLLLTVCTLAFAGLAQRLRIEGRTPEPVVDHPSEKTVLAAVEVKAAGVCRSVPLETVDWIETQGNYLALHAADGTHLIRETLSSFEMKIDPAAFVRIHRRMLVATDRIREVESLGGDAVISLRTGARLRVSRTYTKRLKEALRGRRTA